MSDKGSEASPAPSSKASLLQHPLATMLTGFLLTGVAGTMLTNHYSDVRQREEAAIYQRDARKKAVLELSRAHAELLVHADVLASALARNAPREVLVDLKQKHDMAGIAWGTKRVEILLLAREVVGESDFEALKTEAETRMTKRRMLPARACLDQAWDRAMAGGDAAAALRECDALRLLEECHACSEAICDVLYELSAISDLPATSPRAVEARAKARRTIEQSCP